VWLYGISDWLGFGLIIGLCVALAMIGARSLQSDHELTEDRG
jgi:hypothetical protein